MEFSNLAVRPAGRSQFPLWMVTGITVLTVAALMAYTGNRSASAGQNGEATTSWRQYRDARFHFTLSVPLGWTVRTDERRIVVTSADHAAFAVIENFVPQNDETAEDHVDNLPTSDAALLSRCKITDAYTLDAPAKTQVPNGAQAVTGEQAIGTLTYLGEKGPGQGRVLCLVFPKGGLIFGLAASNDRFAAEQPVMLRILQSFQVTDASGGQNNGSSASKSNTSEPASGLDALTNLHYVNWSDGKEHAFSVDVPTGWTTDGGTFRASILETRQMVLVRSPHDEMAVLQGDAGIPGLFTLPSQRLQFSGHPEGSVWQLPNNMSSLIIHYMPAPEFNHWYLSNFLSKSVNNLEIGEDTDRPEAAEKLTAASNKLLPAGSAAHYSVTIAETRFTCVSKVTGRPMSGVLTSYSSLFLGNAMGEGNWTARPTMYVWAAGDSQTEARQAAVKSVYDHMTKTWKGNPAWVAAETQKQKQFLAASAKATSAVIQANRNAAAQSVVMTRNTTRSSDESRARLMGDFRARMAAKDDNRRKQVNHILDQTDVSDGSQSWKVASGYNNYYRHEASGKIIGTNDPTHPGVGFTQLGQR